MREKQGIWKRRAREEKGSLKGGGKRREGGKEGCRKWREETMGVMKEEN